MVTVNLAAPVKNYNEIDHGLKLDGAVYVKHPDIKLLQQQETRVLKESNESKLNELSALLNGENEKKEGVSEKEFKRIMAELNSIFQDCIDTLLKEKCKNTNSSVSERFITYYVPQKGQKVVVGEKKFYYAPGMAVVAAGPRLEKMSGGRYKACQVFTEAKPYSVVEYNSATCSNEVNQEPKAKQRETLPQLFDAIDGSLMYFASTSNSAMPWKLLCQRVALYSRQELIIHHLQQILTIFPDAYTVETDTCQYKLTARNLLRTRAARKQKFNTLYNDYLKTHASIPLAELPPLTTQITKKRLASERLEALKKSPVKKARKEEPVKKTGSLLDRIRAKEAARAALPADYEQKLAEKNYNDFISSQLSRVSALLLSLQAKSYSMDHVVALIGNSMNFKISKKESVDALHALASRVPGFCSIVSIGPIKAIKISNGWTIQQVEQVIA
ncbi:hypothetical protein TRVA0_041S01002 [Trichomonascus vanleenenianus]|uniref:Tah11p n=1 Tax=Trichomonascus vanleenenianus TaxID=2268995 RepID=UPI003ECB6E7E